MRDLILRWRIKRLARRIEELHTSTLCAHIMGKDKKHIKLIDKRIELRLKLRSLKRKRNGQTLS